MKFNQYLGLSNINNFDIITNDIKKNYKIYGEVSPYSCNFELLSYNTENKYFNNRHKLYKLIKKKYKISHNGLVFKAILKNKNKKYYKNIFIKEIPIYPYNFDYKKTLKNVVSNNEYKHYFYKYNTNSYANIEIFVSYICSRMYELDISPTFCLIYGCYTVHLAKFSYEINDIPHNILKNCKIYQQNNEVILEKRNCPVYLLALEKLDFDIETIKELCELDLMFFKSIFFQIYAAIFTMFNLFGIKHNDLHVGNIMFKITDKQFIYYKLGKKHYKIPTYGFIIKIIDWGRGTYNYNFCEGKNSIFNKNTPCENQMIFTRINKKKYINYEWTDILIVTQNILYNFPEIKQYRNFYNFLRNILKTNNNFYISTKLFNWDIYEHISKNKFNIEPYAIITNTEFKNFITKEISENQKVFEIII